MMACRASTLTLAQQITDDEYFRQAHPDFSPVGWHLGHIAFTEALWILEHLAGQPNPLAEHRLLFAADGLPKTAREQVPDWPTTLEYLTAVRNNVFHYLERASLPEQSRLWWWLLQHESQHVETISIVVALHRRKQGRYLLSDQRLQLSSTEAATAAECVPMAQTPMVFMPGTKIVVGSDGVDAIDNEQPPFTIQVDSFCIDIHPVTQGQFRTLMEANGYHDPQWWSSQGWAWRCNAGVEQPLYWSEDSALDSHPVCGVSYYEAEAYANFVGKRLPTEFE
jgi:formylglycine-generating enzyme required for sulfatase activity